MGSSTFPGLHPWADLPLHHPAAVLQAHAATVDEPVRGDHHGHGAGVTGGRARRDRHRADRQQHREHHLFHRADLPEPAGLVLCLLLPDFPSDPTPGATLCLLLKPSPSRWSACGTCTCRSATTRCSRASICTCSAARQCRSSGRPARVSRPSCAASPVCCSPSAAPFAWAAPTCTPCPKKPSASSCANAWASCSSSTTCFRIFRCWKTW